MPRNTSISLGGHFDAFINAQIESGRYASTSEVIRSGLRLLEEEETKLANLRQLLQEGENSELVEYTLDNLIEELDGPAN